MKSVLKRVALPALVAALTVACSDSDPASPETQPGSIAEVATTAGFSELVSALAYVDRELDAGLVDLFQNGDGPFTVFAPTNAAFDDLYALLSTVLGTPIDEITDVPAAVVLDVLKYHVATGRVTAAAAVPSTGERSVTPLLGEGFAIRANATIRDGLTGLRDDATIVTTDVDARNGIIHVIDQVIVPPSVVAAITN